MDYFKIALIGILVCFFFVGFYGGNYYAESQSQPEPVKAKVLTQFGCVETTLTIEEWYYQAKLLCSIGQCDKVGRICN